MYIESYIVAANRTERKTCQHCLDINIREKYETSLPLRPKELVSNSSTKNISNRSLELQEQQGVDQPQILKPHNE